MPKRVCRLRWRKGEPLSLVQYPSTTFLDLSRELRDRIYWYVLVSSDPITVYSGHYEWTTGTKDGKHIFTESITIDPIDPTLAQFTFGLMYCNRQVAAEAIATFYCLNTFRFAGHEAWQPMYRWMSLIGESNRAHLRNLIAEVRRSDGLTQDRNGRHKFYLHHPVPWQFHKVEHSYDPGKDLLEGVDYLSPAIEACFRILGKTGHALTLSLILPHGFLPGVLVWCEGWDSLAIPKLVERSRKEFTADRVAVLWKGVGIRDRFLEQQGVIEARGWKIIDAREGPTPREYVGRFELPTMLFTIRRF